MVEAVLFDFNGTLFQDSVFNEDAWLEFAHKIAGRKITKAEFDQHIHGKVNRLALEYLFERPFTAEEALVWGEKKEDIYRQMVRDNPAKAHLTPGAHELFEYLRENKIPFNIATAAGRGNVDFYYEIFDLAKWFPFQQIVYDDGTVASKPAPDFYLQGAAKIGVKAQDALIFEDSVSGLKAAYHAKGAKIVGIATDHNEQELSALGFVDFVVKDFHDKAIYQLFV